MKKDTIVTVLMVGGLAYGVYWYLTTYGPNGPVATVGGPSFWDQWFAGMGNPAGTSTTTVPATQGATGPGASPAPAPSPIANNPQMSVQTASGNPHQFKVGDAWSVTITGAAPNVPVDVTAIEQGGQGRNIPHATGNTRTDAQGRFVSSGVADINQVGTWVEQWNVGGAILSWQFIVSPAATGADQGVGNAPRGMAFSGGNVQAGRGFKGGFQGTRKSTGGYIQ